jgi:hypothetical protein
MYITNLIEGIALEALYCDSRRSWVLNFGLEPELWLMSRKRWFRAFRQALDELANEPDSDARFVIDWDVEPEPEVYLQ